MSKKNMIEAVAEGIKGELDGISIYEAAAERSLGEIKEFFLDRAAEEKMHYNWLASYYRKLMKAEDADVDLLPGVLPDKPSPIISVEFLERIGSDSFLSAAISSSILLELNAIDHYRKSAEISDDLDVKMLFTELADWEKDHYEMLLKIQEDSRQSWYNAQSFEPF
ncbi:MAG: ferritin family protein [Spirochaetales bacterium]|nr:ferritin family protein [Spirochaetales bacterium]